MSLVKREICNTQQMRPAVTCCPLQGELRCAAMECYRRRWQTSASKTILALFHTHYYCTWSLSGQIVVGLRRLLNCLCVNLLLCYSAQDCLPLWTNTSSVLDLDLDSWSVHDALRRMLPVRSCCCCACHLLSGPSSQPYVMVLSSVDSHDTDTESVWLLTCTCAAWLSTNVSCIGLNLLSSYSPSDLVTGRLLLLFIVFIHCTVYGWVWQLTNCVVHRWWLVCLSVCLSVDSSCS